MAVRIESRKLEGKGEGTQNSAAQGLLSARDSEPWSQSSCDRGWFQEADGDRAGGAHPVADAGLFGKSTPSLPCRTQRLGVGRLCRCAASDGLFAERHSEPSQKQPHWRLFPRTSAPHRLMFQVPMRVETQPSCRSGCCLPANSARRNCSCSYWPIAPHEGFREPSGRVSASSQAIDCARAAHASEPYRQRSESAPERAKCGVQPDDDPTECRAVHGEGRSEAGRTPTAMLLEPSISPSPGPITPQNTPQF